MKWIQVFVVNKSSTMSVCERSKRKKRIGVQDERLKSLSKRKEAGCIALRIKLTEFCILSFYFLVACIAFFVQIKVLKIMQKEVIEIYTRSM